MNLKIKYKRNRPQQLFHTDDISFLLALIMGYGGGKTHGLIMKLLKLHWLNRPYSGGIVAQSLPDFKKDVLPLFRDILEDNRIKYFYHQGDKYFKFPWSKGQIQFASAESKIKGPNWAYAGINEVTLIKYERFLEVMGRVRIKKAPNPQIVFSGTPEGYGSEYYEPFIEKPLKGLRLISGTTYDNRHNLHESFITNLESNYDSKMQQAYLMGEFINMQGNRFYYNYDPTIHDNSKLEDPMIRNPQDFSRAHVFMDFNVDPMVATVWHFDGRSIYAFDEIVISGTDTTIQMCHALESRGYGPTRATIYPDPSGNQRSTKGQPDIQILKNFGFTEIKYRSVAPGMRQRQLNVNNIFEKGLACINPIKCPTLKKDLLGVEQDKVTLEKIKKNPKLTHASDGMDYGFDILFPFSGKRSSTTSQTYR